MKDGEPGSAYGWEDAVVDVGGWDGGRKKKVDGLGRVNEGMWGDEGRLGGRTDGWMGDNVSAEPGCAVPCRRSRPTPTWPSSARHSTSWTRRRSAPTSPSRRSTNCGPGAATSEPRWVPAPPHPRSPIALPPPLPHRLPLSSLPTERTQRGVKAYWEICPPAASPLRVPTTCPASSQ